MVPPECFDLCFGEEQSDAAGFFVLVESFVKAKKFVAMLRQINTQSVVAEAKFNPDRIRRCDET